MMPSLVRRGLVLAATLLLVAACGGSGSSDTPASGDPTVPTDGPGSTPSGTDDPPTHHDPGTTSDARPDTPECPADGPLRNIVPASPWATDRAGIATYRYVADVIGTGVAELALHDADDEVLGVVSVRQLLGGDDDNGVMEGDFTGADGERLRLVTRGEALTAEGYTVRAWLERTADGARVEFEARFDTVRCWSVEDDAAGPPCAGALPTLDPEVLVPGCGLISDERIHAGAPAELTQLAWLTDAASGADEGAIVQRGDAALSRLDVFADGVALDPTARTAWIAAHGADLLETDAARLLATAWLDRAWWRTLEHHVAHCEVTLLDQPAAAATKSRCPGDHRSDRWGSPSTGRSAGVFGDPNFVSLDGHAWGFHATGEYVLVEATDGEPFVLHGRFEPVLVVPVPECLGVSLSTGLATLLDGHRITILQGPPFQILVNDTLIESADQLPDLADGHELSILLDRVRMRWPGGEEVTARAGPELLTVTVTLPPERRGAVRGLLGQFDGRSGNDYMLPDGTVLPQPLSFETMYDVLGPAWRLDAASTLFHHPPGEGPDDFHIPGFPEAPVRVANLPADRVAEAEPVCDEQGITDPHLRSACIIDVVCMEDPDVAESTADAPLPVSSQPPGFHDLALSGDVRQVEPPSALDLAAEQPPETCGPWRPQAMSLFTEQEDVDLDTALDVDLAGPGTIRTGHEGSATIPAGTRVRSWHLSRRAPQRDERVHNAVIRFDQPIRGVIVEPDGLTATDTTFGVDDTTYPADGPGGLNAPEDRVTLEPDGRTLRITWTGGTAHRLRILVEAP